MKSQNFVSCRIEQGIGVFFPPAAQGTRPEAIRGATLRPSGGECTPAQVPTFDRRRVRDIETESFD